MLGTLTSAGLQVSSIGDLLLLPSCSPAGRRGGRHRPLQPPSLARGLVQQEAVHTEAGPEVVAGDLLLVDPDPVRDGEVGGGGPLAGGANLAVSPVLGLLQPGTSL